MLNLPSKTIAGAIALWIGFAIFGHLGEYPEFLIPFFERVLELKWIHAPISRLIDLFSFNPLTPEWLTARFTVTICLGLNFILVRLLLGRASSYIFLILVSIVLVSSVIASPLGLTNARIFLYNIQALAMHPALLLILIPVRVVYLRSFE